MPASYLQYLPFRHTYELYVYMLCLHAREILVMKIIR